MCQLDRTTFACGCVKDVLARRCPNFNVHERIQGFTPCLKQHTWVTSTERCSSCQYCHTASSPAAEKKSSEQQTYKQSRSTGTRQSDVDRSKRYEPERYKPAAHASYYQHHDRQTGRRWKRDESPRQGNASEAGRIEAREKRMEDARQRSVAMTEQERRKDRNARAHFSASAKSGSERKSRDQPAVKPRLRGGRDKSEEERRSYSRREDRPSRPSRGRSSESAPPRETQPLPIRASQPERRKSETKKGQDEAQAKEKGGNDPTYFRILLPVALRVVKFAFADGKFPWG